MRPDHSIGKRDGSGSTNHVACGRSPAYDNVSFDPITCRRTSVFGEPGLPGEMDEPGDDHVE